MNYSCLYTQNNPLSERLSWRGGRETGGTVNARWPSAPPPSSKGMHAALAFKLLTRSWIEAFVGAPTIGGREPTKDGFSSVAGCSHGCGLSPETVVWVSS
jgi:hypothetical protein